MASTTFDINTTVTDVMDRFGANAKGKTYVITGPSKQSLGAGAATGLAAGNPNHLILVGRSRTRIQPVIDEIKSKNPNVDAIFVEIDLLSLDSVRAGAEKIKSLTREIHGLINCAGIMAVEQYTESKDGIEAQFATNHVSHFLLTNLLKDELVKGQAVIANVSSGGYELADIDYDDVNFDSGKKYNAWEGYAHAKTANLLFSVSLAEKGKKNGLAAFGINPGLVVETALQANTNVTTDRFMEGLALYKARNEGKDPPALTPVTIPQGAATIVLPLVDPDLRAKSGTSLHECQDWPIKDYAKDPASAERLWKLSEKLVKQEFSW